MHLDPAGWIIVGSKDLFIGGGGRLWSFPCDQRGGLGAIADYVGGVTDAIIIPGLWDLILRLFPSVLPSHCHCSLIGKPSVLQCYAGHRHLSGFLRW